MLYETACCMSFNRPLPFMCFALAASEIDASTLQSWQHLQLLVPTSICVNHADGMLGTTISLPPSLPPRFTPYPGTSNTPKQSCCGMWAPRCQAKRSLLR